MIRPTLPADTNSLLEIARGTGVFKPLEITALGEVLDDYHATNQVLGHRSLTLLDDHQPLGFVYFAPAAMTDRTWYLYWIAVRKDRHARGAGGKMLQLCEQEIRGAGGRLLLIETSSLPHYDATRQFYLKHNYLEWAVLNDYYSDGDHMVVFGKRFEPSVAG